MPAGAVAPALAVPPNPIRGSQISAVAQLGVVCPNLAGVVTHGAYVSGVVLGLFPTDPLEPPATCTPGGLGESG